MDSRHHRALDRRAEAAQFALAIAVELVAWYCAPALFLFACVSRGLLPAEAIAPHLRAVLLPLLAFILFRLVVAASETSAAAARITVAAVAAALLSLMISYYALVMIGLLSWGEVISWPLIAAYGPHAPHLAEALGISLALIAGGAALGVFGLFALAWLHLRRFDWAPLVRASRPPRFALAVGGIALAGAAELYGFVTHPAAEASEPFALTLRPRQAAWDFQGHRVDRLKAARLDAAEDAERRDYRPSATAARRNMILIVVDALRPDHMGIFGYARDTTPTLVRLEQAGALRKAVSLRATCASSVCGLLGISASRFVHQLSVRPITLQEVLRRHGYRIHMVLSGDHTSFYGLKQAYGEVDSYFDATAAGPGRYLNDDRIVLERLAALAPWDGAPVMIQLHLISVHPVSRRERGMARYTPEGNYAPYSFAPDAAGPPRESAINYYDNGVLQADAVIGEALGTLERKGYLRDALVAITADHGEALGEHGFFKHAQGVYDEVLRIPFLLLSRGAAPAPKPFPPRAVASQADIAPTVLAELGMPRPKTWRGVPLQEPAPGAFVFFQQGHEAGLFDPRDARILWKYWVNLRSGEEYAFDLTLDPGERQNAIGRVPLQLKREWRLQLLQRG
jgi:glucan phosphoethanolaminetransferase (alkaline phosphatase superfamily)